MNKKYVTMTMAAMAIAGLLGANVYAGEKQDLVMDIDVADEVFTAPLMEKIQEKFGEKYNLIIKTWDGVNEIQTVKTAAIAGDEVDLLMYWPNQMVAFTDSGLATPLDEYMTDEWKSRFADGALDIGTTDGTLYNLSYSTVYPMLIVNKDLADQAGVTLSEDGKWTWDEFLAFCGSVKENTDAYGSVIPSGWTPWLTRNAYLQVWDTDEEMEAFCAGEVSFLDEKIVAASDMVVDSFNNDCFYPGGEASLALSNDEAYAALANGKAASIFVVNSITQSVLEKTGLENYVIMDWPNMGSNPTCAVLGGSNGYFIPTTVKNMEGALEVLDFLTSQEAADIRAEQGCVSTILISENANADKELLDKISRCSAQIHKEVQDNSAELGTYMESMPANYYHHGEAALQEMEDLRLEMIED